MISNDTYSTASMNSERKIDENENKNISAIAKVKKINPDKSFKAVSENLSTSSISYSLYVYRKELQRRRLHIIRLAKAKIELTDGLVIKTINKIHNSLNNGIIGGNFNNEVDILSRKIMYKKKLQQRIKCIETYLKKKNDEKQKIKTARVESPEQQESVSGNLQES